MRKSISSFLVYMLFFSFPGELSDSHMSVWRRHGGGVKRSRKCRGRDGCVSLDTNLISTFFFFSCQRVTEAFPLFRTPFCRCCAVVWMPHLLWLLLSVGAFSELRARLESWYDEDKETDCGEEMRAGGSIGRCTKTRSWLCLLWDVINASFSAAAVGKRCHHHLRIHLKRLTL